jgi:peroxiredoxin
VTDGHSPEEPVVPQGPPDGGAAEPPKVDVILTPPKVLLSAGHQELCLVSVGDAMPAISLPDAAGETQGLKQLFGEKLTVVLFWNSTHPYAQEQFERFHLEVVAPYGAHGVGAVAINVGDDPASVKAVIEGIKDGFPVLFDEGGESLSLVATRKLPRTYLLDPAGRILWFDIEYSESTRRELKNAILWHLTRQS